MSAPSLRAPPAVLMGLPSLDGQVSTVFVESLVGFMDVARRSGITVALKFLTQESNIARGRNAIASQFMSDRQFTHLLFIDVDTGFDPHSILAMLDLNHPLTGCAYPKKTLDWSRIADAARAGTFKGLLAAAGLDYAIVLPEQAPGVEAPVEVVNGFIRVAKCGTGIMLIQRQVFEAIRLKYPELSYQTDIGDYAMMGWDFFGYFDHLIDPKTNTYTSCDYAFCHRWTVGCGGEIWVDVASTATHVGVFRYSGSFLKTAGLD